MRHLLSTLLIGIMFFMSACSQDTSPQEDPSTKEVLTKRADDIRQLSLLLQKTLVETLITDANITDAWIKNSQSLMLSTQKMVQSFTNNIELMSSITLSFTKKMTLSSSYTELFTTNLNFTSLTPYIAMSTLDDSKNYLLLSSSSPLFLNNQSIKTLFSNPDTLLVAWQRAIEFSKDKNLFLNIYEIKSDGSMFAVGTPFMILKDQVDLLKM